MNFSKEWLENVINSNVFPRIENIFIKPISLNSRYNDIVYVVNINKSLTIHEASDYRYYKGYNFESVPMYDFEIRDIMNRNEIQKNESDFEMEHSTYKAKSMFPTMLFSSSQENQSFKKIETTSNVYGGDMDEYMQIMLTVL